MPTEVRTITNREEWLLWRLEDVTASNIGALFGVHPYCTALRLYAEKRGTEFPFEDNPAMRRGRWMEPAVAKAVMETRPEWTLVAATEYYRDPELRIGATPDFYIEGDPRGKGICQAKTVAPSVYERDWAGGAEPPLWIIQQALTEAMLTNADFVVIAALLVDAHNMEVSIHELPRHPAAEAKIREAVAQFWNDVENGHEPMPDFQRDADVIKALWRRERTPPNEIDLSGNNELPELLAERSLLRSSIKNAEARVDAIDAEVKYTMKDAAIATGIPGWNVTYKTNSVKAYLVPAREQRVLRVMDRREKT